MLRQRFSAAPLASQTGNPGRHERLTEVRASASLLQLADHLFDSPVITIPEAERLLGVTYRSAQLNVEKLVDADILRQVGEGDYRKTFVAGEILDVVGTQVG